MTQVVPESLKTTTGRDFSSFAFDSAAFMREVLLWTPWSGADTGKVGQLEILNDYDRVLRQLTERQAYENGELTRDDLRDYDPDVPVRNRFHISAGHGVGKTKLASGMLLHFHYCFAPSIIYSYAPTSTQIKDLLWKEVGVSHAALNLPGRCLETCRLSQSRNHFATGHATTDAHGLGGERTQGQHAPYMMFLLDEAEGVANYVYESVDAMASGGICVVLTLGNPRTRSSPFFMQQNRSDCRHYELSCFNHPNVVQGRDVIPGGVRRDYIEIMAEKHASPVEEHDPTKMTFVIPWKADSPIYEPKAEFYFRVYGIAPDVDRDDTLISEGAYRAAVGRDVPDGAWDEAVLRYGVDCARFGSDFGTAWRFYNGVAQRVKRFAKNNTLEYTVAIKSDIKEMLAKHPSIKDVQVRVDGGGGFGGGVVDNLRADEELRKAFEKFAVLEVHFNGDPHTAKAYADLVTEMYGCAAERMAAIAIRSAPDELYLDLTDRRFEWRISAGMEVKRLEDKDDFRDRQKRSPDDGDGFVMAVAPDYAFVVPSDSKKAVALQVDLKARFRRGGYGAGR